MNIEDCEYKGEDISRLEYLKMSKIEELESDKLSTAWFVYEFNESVNVVYEADKDNPNWKEELKAKLNDMKAVG